MKNTDYLEFIESLPLHEYKNPSDRYKEFRQVFNTPQGKRVFREILGWGGLFRRHSESSPIDPYKLAIYTGQTNMAKKLLEVVTIEPPIQPEKQNVK